MLFERAQQFSEGHVASSSQHTIMSVRMCCTVHTASERYQEWDSRTCYVIIFSSVLYFYFFFVVIDAVVVFLVRALCLVCCHIAALLLLHFRLLSGSVCGTLCDIISFNPNYGWMATVSLVSTKRVLHNCNAGALLVISRGWSLKMC